MFQTTIILKWVKLYHLKVRFTCRHAHRYKFKSFMSTTCLLICIYSIYLDTIRAEAKSHNNVHLMLVDGMSKLMTRQVENCVSSDFYVGGLKW